MSDHVEFDALDALALGTLDDDRRVQVQQHLAQCAGCRREYDELRAVLDVLPHALPAEPPSAALRDRIMAAIDAPAPAPAGRAFPLVGALAATLLLALIGDAYLAFALHARADAPIAALTSPSPAFPAAPPAANRTTPVAQKLPARPPASRSSTPAAHATPIDRAASDERTVVAALERRLARVQATEGADARQIARLERELAAARSAPRIVRIGVAAQPQPQPKPGRSAEPIAAASAEPTPPALAGGSPSLVASGSPPPVAIATAAPTQPPSDAQLVAALRTGHVYAIDGAVDGEPWHLTVVQPRDGERAVIFSGTPDAPAGDTYRTWVIRGGRTFDAGELPPHQQSTLEMPMALAPGDVVAFSREPVGSGDLPTQPFLMQLKIAQ